MALLFAQPDIGMPTLPLRGQRISAALLCQILWALPAAAEEPYAVAGLALQARPEGAPVIASFEHTLAWRTRALKGIAEPHPPNLNFLDDQGAWYTPFSRPGMAGPYDLRGWHASGKTEAAMRREGGK